MCGRYTYFPSEFADLRVRWNLDQIPLLTQRFNIAPSQEAPVIVQAGAKRNLEMLHWGLIPWWAKDPIIGNKMINARAETLAEKSAFKQLLGTHRCLVLADGFYEWRKEGQRKIPMRFKLKSGAPFTFAGLWDSWRQPDGTLLRSYTIVTTEPNDLLRPIHNRMPAMLSDHDALKWLSAEGQETSQALALLKPFPANEMAGYDVSSLVNDPRNDSLECVEPVSSGQRPHTQLSMI
jgi:putative SOS response-associated peptidase YedK